MTKNFRDKTIALLGAGLLGYYLGLSLFRGIIRDFLFKILPPINSRHLPDLYFGIMGAVLAILLTYLIFNMVVEKRSFKIHQKSYLAVITLLIIVPLMIAGIFRVHAVSLVTKAESTTPTDITIRSNRSNRAGNSLMFRTSSSSASGVAKSIEVTKPHLEDFGKMIEELELTEVVSGKEQKFDQPQLTMWINYRRADGKWYSKIISYDQGLFEEWVAGERLAYYKNSELEELLEKLLADSQNISNYNQARIYNSLGIDEKKTLNKDDFQAMVNSLNSDNLIQQDTEGVSRIKDILENWVPQEERNIYAIELLQKDSTKRIGQNFMAYDQLTHTLMFEGKYYKVDLTRLVEK